MKLLIFISIFIFVNVKAQAVLISEIMYDPQGSDTDREWIEIYNDTGNVIDFTSWKFFESGVNHGISISSGGTNVQPNGYAVIADNPTKFLIDFPNFSGILYDSAFSLSNSGEQLIMKDAGGTVVNTVNYITTVGGNNDGSSLSLINDKWARGNATPGAVNQESTLITNGNTATTTGNQITVTQMSPPSADIIIYLPFEKVVVAGADTEFSTYGMTRAGKEINDLIYSWAFGDGGQGVGSTTLYRYSYPGRYVAQVEGRNNYLVGNGRMLVRVVPPDLIIKKIDVGKHGTYVDILNPNNYDLDLSQWRLLIDGIPFSFPKNTTILGGNTTRLSGLAMGFASTTVSSSTEVKIMFPNQEIISSYKKEESVVLGVSTSTTLVKPSIISSRSNLGQVKSTTTFSTTTKSLSDTQKDKKLANWVKNLFKRQ